MAFNFPSNPTAGQVYGNYTYNATTNAWDIISFSDGIPAGVIMAWGASSAPANWLICDGTAVSRSTYASLFNAIGTTYGSGDGSTTFNLPDLRGRVPVGKNGATFGTLGSTGGAETHTLTEAQMPSHTHIQNSHNHTQDAHSHAIYGSNGGSAGVSISITSNSNGDRAWYLPGGIAANTTATNQATTATNQNAGGNQAHNNLQPYVVTNYIIKYSAANTPGDSELATRVGAIETTTVRSVALGGTGASDAATARSNLGITPQNIGATPISGSVVQVVTGNTTNIMSGAINGVDFFTMSFTPKYSNSKLLIQSSTIVIGEYNNVGNEFYMEVFFDSTQYIVTRGNGGHFHFSNSLNLGFMSLNHTVNSWGTSTRTFKVRFGGDSNNSLYVNYPYYTNTYSGSTAGFSIIEIAA